MRVSSRFVMRWIAVTIAASLIAAVDGGFLRGWTALVPSRVWTGEVWRLVTWPLIEGSPLQLVLTCVAIYKFGGELAYRWGDRRLRRFMLQIVIAAGAVTCVLVALTGAYYIVRLGGWAVTDALVIAWARQFPDAPLRLYEVLVLRGRDVVRLTVAVAIVFAIYFGPIYMAPELVACTAAAGYPRGWLRR
ncbi:MAG: rhomboid family intramembrane serine protease [Acidobacteriota bacterium]